MKIMREWKMLICEFERNKNEEKRQIEWKIEN